MPATLLEQTTVEEDLKAFERRLVEVVGYMQPSTSRWRMLLAISSVSAFIGAYQWLADPSTIIVPLFLSLYQHLYFTASLVILLILFMVFGVHKRVVAPSIIVSRCRAVLEDFNISCDDSGKLILRTRPTTP